MKLCRILLYSIVYITVKDNVLEQERRYGGVLWEYIYHEIVVFLLASLTF